MCLAIPGKVVKIDKKKGTAIVDYGAEKREAGIMPGSKIKINDYVIVQTKFIVQKIPKKEALESLELYSKI